METITVKVNTEVLEKATNILKKLGLDIDTFINMALIQLIKNGGIPFEVETDKPNKELLEAIAEVEEMLKNPKKYPRYTNREDLKKALLEED